MALPTCDCVKGLPIGEQLAAIYCATYTLAAGDVDGPYLLKAANLSDVADPVASLANIGGAANGVNSDITEITGLTTPLSVVQGGTGFNQAAKVIAYPAVNQTLTSGGTSDTVAFGTEVVDTAGAFAANTFTVPAGQGGFYYVSVSCIFLQGGGSTAGINVSIAVNGSAVARLMQRPLDAGFSYGVGGDTMLQLSAGDAVTITITQTDGAGWEILGGISTLGRLSIHRLI